MAKNFPYFKFIPTEWLTGDIVYEDYCVQGLFVNICALYWQRDGKLTIDDIKKRYKSPKELDELTDRFFTVNDGFIRIKFLDEQLIDANHISKVNSANGSLGGRPRITDRLPTDNRPDSEPEPKKSKEEEEVNKNKKKKKITIFPPTLSDVKEYFKENGYTEDSACKFFSYYSTENWHDKNGNEVKSWKLKAQSVWFKSENEMPKPINIREQTREDFWDEQQYKDYCLKSNITYQPLTA